MDLRREFFREPPELMTERLLLRKMRSDDAGEIFAYASDPEVTRYMRWETHRTIDDSRAFLDLVLGKYEGGGEPDWGIVHKESGRFTGTCGFIEYSPEHSRIELGYVLAKEFWGRGLMPEAVRAIIRFGFEELGLNRIEARCIAENIASATVIGEGRDGLRGHAQRAGGHKRRVSEYENLLDPEWRVPPSLTDPRVPPRALRRDDPRLPRRCRGAGRRGGSPRAR
ncbi:MAG: GNAT family N-acetyltransferase [Actinomycetota bacterium]|nr:GNAT family N-acetyltransferase [Actinomycetota bacterium]